MLLRKWLARGIKALAVARQQQDRPSSNRDGQEDEKAEW